MGRVRKSAAEGSLTLLCICSIWTEVIDHLSSIFPLFNYRQAYLLWQSVFVFPDRKPSNIDMVIPFENDLSCLGGEGKIYGDLQV